MTCDLLDDGKGLLGVSVVLSVLQIVLVAARFYTRRLQREQFGCDDWVMLVALAGSLGKAVIFIVRQYINFYITEQEINTMAVIEIAGLGAPFSDIDHIRSFTLIKKGFWVVELLDFPLTITPAKISLLLFYVRIFYTRKFKIFAYLVGFPVLGLGIAMFFQTIFQCSPIDYGWKKTPAQGSCINQMLVYGIISPINVFTGILILVMPMPVVWKLHAPRGQKLALTGVFLLGGVGTVASILRVILYLGCSGSQLQHVTGFSIKLGILTVVEGAILIIAPCLVSIWPLLTRTFQGKMCYPGARQHRRRYINMQTPTNSPCGSIQIRRNNILGSSPSLAELEEQCRWVPDGEDSTPPSGERVVVDYDSKN